MHSSTKCSDERTNVMLIRDVSFHTDTTKIKAFSYSLLISIYEIGLKLYGKVQTCIVTDLNPY
jgi:hypothetical protein